MLTASTPDLDLLEAYVDSDPRGRVFPAFPINRFTGAEHTAVVYFEVQPGDYLPTHTDSAEEILYIVAGEAEAEVGDQRGRISKGDLAVIPAMVPHSLLNVGTETVKVVGFVSDSEIISTFQQPVQPFGVSVMNQGAPAEA